MANSSSSVGSNLTSLSSSSFSSSSSSSSSDGFHFIHPPSPSSPYVSSPEPNFDPAPVHEPWGFEDGLPIDEVEWNFEAMDTDESSIDSAGSYGFSSSTDARISWVPEDEYDQDEVNSAPVISDDDIAAAEEWAKWGSSSEDEDEDRPKNAGWPHHGPMDVDANESGDDEDEGDEGGHDEDDDEDGGNA